MIKLRFFKKEDIKILKPMMKDAFDQDGLMHINEACGPDGYDDGTMFTEWFLHHDATPITIYNDDKIIGAANLWISKENINYLGCFFIAPEYENKGYGTEAWKKIEEMYPSTIEWRVETPAFSRRNHYFYVNKCGFAIVKINRQKDPNEDSYYLSKKMK